MNVHTYVCVCVLVYLYIDINAEIDFNKGQYTSFLQTCHDGRAPNQHRPYTSSIGPVGARYLVYLYRMSQLVEPTLSQLRQCRLNFGSTELQPDIGG